MQGSLLMARDQCEVGGDEASKDQEPRGEKGEGLIMTGKKEE